MIALNVLIFLQKYTVITGLSANGMTREYIDSISCLERVKQEDDKYDLHTDDT